MVDVIVNSEKNIRGFRGTTTLIFEVINKYDLVLLTD